MTSSRSRHGNPKPALLALLLLTPFAACGGKDTEAAARPSQAQLDANSTSTHQTTARATTRDTLAVEAIEVARETLRILRTVEDKTTAARAATALTPLVARSHSLRAAWKATGKTQLTDLNGLRKRHKADLKSLGIDTGKTIGVLTWRWKSRELRKSIATLRQVLGAANAIRKALRVVKD